MSGLRRAPRGCASRAAVASARRLYVATARRPSKPPCTVRRSRSPQDPVAPATRCRWAYSRSPLPALHGQAAYAAATPAQDATWCRPRLRSRGCRSSREGPRCWFPRDEPARARRRRAPRVALCSVPSQPPTPQQLPARRRNLRPHRPHRFPRAVDPGLLALAARALRALAGHRSWTGWGTGWVGWGDVRLLGQVLGWLGVEWHSTPRV